MVRVSRVSRISGVRVRVRASVRVRVRFSVGVSLIRWRGRIRGFYAVFCKSTFPFNNRTRSAG